MGIKEDLKKYAKEIVRKEVNEKGYFNSYKDNIFGNTMDEEFQKMFDAGNGGELHSKAEALHSSSMLSYNFFHVIKKKPIIFRDVEYYKVLFEVKFKTLKGRSNPANMDVVLIGKKSGHDHVLFVESKFLEYTENQTFEISDTYKDSKRWLDENVKWVEIINSVPNEKKGYYNGIKQIITHLFGIHGYLNGEKCEDMSDVILKDSSFEFVTMAFEPQDLYLESGQYCKYKKLFDQFRDKIPKNVNLKVFPEWVSYSEFWKEVKEQYPEDLRKYLDDKYMKLAK